MCLGVPLKVLKSNHIKHCKEFNQCTNKSCVI